MERQISIKTLEDEFCTLAYHQGLDASRVFDDMMQYIIYGFAPNHTPLTNWSYSKEQTLQIYNLMTMRFQVMAQETAGRGWYDVLGTLYENTIAGKGRRSNAGQFFTPMHICDLMSGITYPKDQPIEKNIIGDPTCGSGRTLLAFNAIHPGNYLVAEDIDRTCAMMSVCNFLIHGCVGEVIWHDAMQPDSFYGGWKVNEGLNNPLHEYYGIPHCRTIEQQESHVWKLWHSKKQKSIKPTAHKVEVEPIKQIQLSLF